MAKLYFHYSAMNAGKSTLLLQAAHNYTERGMAVLMITAALDTRLGEGRIGSRIGLSAEAAGFDAETDIAGLIREMPEPLSCVFIDEAQFLTDAQVWQLASIVDEDGVPVMAYGLRTDFQGRMFSGSAALLALADELREVRTICHCGRKATMVLRLGPEGEALRDGNQIQIGGDESYVSLCRRHWRDAMEGA